MTWAPVTDTRLPGGLRLVVLPAPASPVVEARLVVETSDATLARALHDPPARALERERDLLIAAATAAPDRLDECLRGLAGPPVLREATPAPRNLRDRLRRELLAQRFAAHPHTAEPRAGVRSTGQAQAGFVSASTLLLLAGGVEPAAAVLAAGRHLAEFAPAGPPRQRIRARESFTPARFIDDPGATYATVLAAAPAPDPADDDFAAVLLAAELVGGGPGAALHRRLSSRFAGLLSVTCVVEHAAGGAWLAVEADVLDAAGADVAETVLAELAATTWHVPTPEAWRTARAAAFRSTVVAYAGTAQTATACARAVAYGLPPRFWLTLPDLLAAVEIDQVTAAAQRYFARDSFAVAASGPAHHTKGRGNG